LARGLALANFEETQGYIDAHAGSGGDAEMLEDCQSFPSSTPHP
jgi:hypothetical protein